MKTFELNLSREGERIRICASEQQKPTLKQYEDKEVYFTKIDGLCDEILSVLNRANRRGDIADTLITDLKKAGQDLFDELLTPKAKELIRSTSLKTLSLEIDDRLVHIPWELLFDGGQFLCRRFSIGRMVSTKQHISGSHHRKIDGSMKMLIVADPKENLAAAYREGIKVRDELIGLEDRIKVNLVSSRVDTQYIRRNIRDYDIVHYTGHAEYDEDDPLKCGWHMSDGIWNVPDIRNIAGETPFPFLIFANACHSGRTGRWRIDKSYEKEIFDLANTFLHCGVSHYIGTFLEVLDSPGSTFAIEFYKALSTDVSIGEAVRNAREQVVDRFGEKNIIWASYMLYGDPSYRISRETPRIESTSKVISKVSYAIIFLIILTAIYFSVKELKTHNRPPGQDKGVVAVTVPPPFKVSLKQMTGRLEEPGKAFHDILSEGSKLYMYDEFKFILTSNKNAYFYLLISDGNGKTTLLYHDHGVHTNDLLTETEYSLSIQAHVLRLDANPATEAVYILASESKLTETEPIIWEIEKLNEHVGTERAGILQDKGNQRDYEIITRIEIVNGRVKAIRQ
jgi:CHAT domain-containing protein